VTLFQFQFVSHQKFYSFRRLKRVEWSLAIAWKQLTSFSHVNRLEISRPLKVVFHKCTLHRARMMHVVTNLAAFLMFEVMESAWVTLGERVHGASCLDEVVAAHDAYLSEVLDKALLAPHHEQLNVLVQALLQSILRFCSLEDILIAGELVCVIL
jgi:gamma-tubulin complex component 3